MSGATVVQNGTTYFVTFDTYQLGATDAWVGAYGGADRWSLGVRLHNIGPLPAGTRATTPNTA